MSLGQQINKGFNLNTQIIFFHQLAVLMRAGIPLAKALLAAKAGVSAKECRTIEELMLKISHGHQFSEALRTSRGMFKPYIVALVVAGELRGTGKLLQAFEQIAASLEAQQNFIRSVKLVLHYPMFIVTVSLFMILALIKFALPTFVALFSSLHVKLPPLTLLLLEFIQFINSPFFLYTFILFLLCICAYIYFVLKTPQGKEQWDGVLLSLPVIGKVVIYIAAARFCRALADLYASGVPIIKSLELASSVTDNVILKEQISHAAIALTKGDPLYIAIQRVKFPSIMSSFLAVAEETGDFSNLLLSTASFFKQQLECFTSTAQSLIEPIVMLTLGIVIGLFMLAFFVPVYTAISGFGG